MLLEVKNLKYDREERTILKELNFNISTKGITAILGANGSGKSTLLSLIAGFLQPASGYISFNGKKVIGPAYKLVPGHDEIALVRQDMRLTPYATVRENLHHILRHYNDSEQDAESLRLASLLGFEKHLDKTLKFLSGGEQQRVCIAAALASKPSLLLLDEPFSQTDIHLKTLLKDYLKDIGEKLDINILFVTHDAQEALSLADNIMILHEGQIVEQGTSKVLYYHPELQLTAKFTGVCNWLLEKNISLSKTETKVENGYLLRPEQIALSETPREGYHKSVITKIEFTGILNMVHIRLLESNISLISARMSYEFYAVGQVVYCMF